MAVGDLIGDVAPLRELVTDDDPHGLTDAFLYGVSLNKIARQIDTAGNLHVLPSGSDQVVQEEILRNDRWRRLASGFHEVGALLLVAAPAAVPGVEAPHRHARRRRARGRRDRARRLTLACSPRCRRPRRRSPRARRGRQLVPSRIAEPRRRRWVVPVGRGRGIVAIAAVLGRNYLTRRANRGPPLRRDSAAASDSLDRQRAPAVDSSPPLVVSNPADSANASPFAVQIAMVDTEDGAALRVRAGAGDFPVGTYAPVTSRSGSTEPGTRSSPAHTSIARRPINCSRFLRQRGLVPQGWGTVIRAPLALQVATAPSTTQAAPVIADFQSRKDSRVRSAAARRLRTHLRWRIRDTRRSRAVQVGAQEHEEH